MVLFSGWPSAHHVLIVFHLLYCYAQQQTSKTACTVFGKGSGTVIDVVRNLLIHHGAYDYR
jgi:hypothetical protein